MACVYLRQSQPSETLIAGQDTHAEQLDALQAESVALKQLVGVNAERETIFLKILLLKKDVDRQLAAAIARHVHHYSRVYAQDPDLILSIMYNESRFDPNAVSDKGALGLMQVMPQWKKVLGI